MTQNQPVTRERDTWDIAIPIFLTGAHKERTQKRCPKCPSSLSRYNLTPWADQPARVAAWWSTLVAPLGLESCNAVLDPLHRLLTLAKLVPGPGLTPFGQGLFLAKLVDLVVD